MLPKKPKCIPIILRFLQNYSEPCRTANVEKKEVQKDAV